MTQLVEMFKDIVAMTEAEVLPALQAVNPDISTLHYEHGHYSEIDSTLAKMEDAKTLYNKKYPLVAVFEDIAETVNSGYKEARITIVICYSTKTEYRSEDRYNAVINPILEPIYKELLRQIRLSGYFMEYNIRHTKIVRPYWGVEGKFGNRANILADPLDAIELRDTRLRIYPENEC